MYFKLIYNRTINDYKSCKNNFQKTIFKPVYFKDKLTHNTPHILKHGTFFNTKIMKHKNTKIQLNKQIKY